MKRFAGLDVSLSTTSICVVDGQGHIVFEGVVTNDPEAIGAVLAPHGPDLVGLEAGPARPSCCGAQSSKGSAGFSASHLACSARVRVGVGAALPASLEEGLLMSKFKPQPLWLPPI